jgi:hypothetical protein
MSMMPPNYSTLNSSTGKSAGNSATGGYNPTFSVGKSQGGYRPAQLQQFSPEQMQLFQQMFGQLGPDSFLSRLAGGDEQMFNQIEAPAMRQFQGLQGNIASRFSGMGTGARRSGGFQRTMNQASSDFAQELQSQRMGLQRNAIQDLMGMSNQLLGQRPYENMLIKKDPGIWRQSLMALLNAGGSAGTAAAGSAAGSAARDATG